jgi:hypothetical protein
MNLRNTNEREGKWSVPLVNSLANDQWVGPMTMNCHGQLTNPLLIPRSAAITTDSSGNTWTLIPMCQISWLGPWKQPPLNIARFLMRFYAVGVLTQKFETTNK